jgi:SAM-dependent methyltransferase
MNFYDDPDNVDKYIEMCEGYDGSNLHQLLQKNLAAGSSILELGCGVGADIAALKKHYNMVGSDNSLEFIKRCSARHPELKFLQLNAVELAVDDKFDCLFSNKVLHHLTESDLRTSLEKQRNLLNPKGIIAHSFWLGEGSEEMEGLVFNYYSKEAIFSLVSEYFDIIDTLEYQEFKEGDSIFIIGRKSA